MKNGFIGQGHALSECMEEKRAEDWFLKSLRVLELNEKQIPERRLKGLIRIINSILSSCVENLPGER